jgi:hypothetical protein
MPVQLLGHFSGPGVYLDICIFSNCPGAFLYFNKRQAGLFREIANWYKMSLDHLFVTDSKQMLNE